MFVVSEGICIRSAMSYTLCEEL
uniref:Uncharacterized protein n=1 Tax=Anguilla anguilla TaxID=7936 RepID=A0A0E9P612_ANGAN